MAKIIIVLASTLMGEYGKAFKGDELVVRDNDAKTLVDRGLAEIKSDAKQDEKSPEFKSTNLSKPQTETEGLKITDNTGKPSGAEGETDPKNATGAKVEAPKAPEKTAQAKTSAPVKTAGKKTGKRK